MLRFATVHLLIFLLLNCFGLIQLSLKYDKNTIESESTNEDLSDKTIDESVREDNIKSSSGSIGDENSDEVLDYGLYTVSHRN